MRANSFKQSAIDRVREKRVLTTVEHATYLHGSAPPTWFESVRAAAERGGQRAKATAQTALVLHEVIERTDVIAFVVPFGNRLKLRGGQVVRSRRPITRCRVLDDIPVVSVERALLDAAVLATSVELEDLIEAALRKNKTTEERLWRILISDGGRGVAGSATFRRVLENRPLGKPARSILEVLTGRLLRSRGFQGFVRNLDVVISAHRYELDFAFVNQRVVLEVDGKPFHSTASQIGRDRVRQAALEAAGWRFLRVSWFDVVCQPELVIQQLAALLDA